MQTLPWQGTRLSRPSAHPPPRLTEVVSFTKVVSKLWVWICLAETQTFQCLKKKSNFVLRREKNQTKQTKKCHDVIFHTSICFPQPGDKYQTLSVPQGPDCSNLWWNMSHFSMQGWAKLSHPSSPMREKTSPEHKLTWPAAAPASPHGIHSGSPGRSGYLLWPQRPPAAGLEPAPLAYLPGWDAPCVGQPRSFPKSPLNVL